MSAAECRRDCVPDLVSRLCELHIGAPKKATLRQPKHSHAEKCYRLKKQAWNTLMSQLKGPHCFSSTLVGCESVGAISDVYTWIYYLRLQRKFDEASRLETLIKHLCEVIDDTELLRSIIRLFLKLENAEKQESTAPIGYERKYPIVVPKSQVPAEVPSGPLLYGDTQEYQVEHWYMHYPREVFEQPGISNLDPEPKSQPRKEQKCNMLQIFEAEPGSHLSGNGVFEVKGRLSDAHETSTQTSLYSALVHSTTTSIDVSLELPDLSDETRAPEITVPKLHEGSEDEGFADTSSSVATPSSGPLTPADSGFDASATDDDGDVWERALTYVPCRHRVWENLGRPPAPTERPYLSESGPSAVHHLWAAHTARLRLIDPSLRPPPLQEVTMATLGGDVINLLLGVPSTSFVYDQPTSRLHCCPGLVLPGVTPEGLDAACTDLLECGTDYRRLSEFSRPPLVDSFYQSGLIFQAFTGAVRKYLQHYRACVLSIKPGKTVIEINALMQKAMLQMRFLAELCHCTQQKKPPSPGEGDEDEEGDEEEKEELFPTGVRLLSYLYEETLDVAGSQFYPMMLSLLVSSCGPYLVFVQDWVFHGICRDIYGEYMIQTNDDYLRFRDKHYWTEGYKMITHAAAADAVPLFLADLANDIFVCGKSINLLKLCAPQHFLLTVDQTLPRVQVTFSAAEMAAIDLTCQSYLGRMTQIARAHTLSRQQLAERAEQAKQELLVRARQAALRALNVIQERALAQKKAEDTKKRQVFTELKTQMEKDLQRRAATEIQQKTEDRALVEEASRQEILEATVDQELERQAREELVEYYSALSAEATLREQRALWKVRRAELHNARQRFLDAEQGALLKELRDKQKSEDPITLDDTADLPLWAQRGLASSEDSPQLDTSLQELPSWAKDALQQPDEDVILNLEFAQEGTKKVVDSTSNDNLAKKENEQPTTVEESTDDVSLETAVEEKKQHVSQSVVGDVMRSEPKLDQEVEPTRYVGVVTEQKSADHHPSVSTIQNLMYAEPERKTASLEKETKLEEAKDVPVVQSDDALLVDLSSPEKESPTDSAKSEVLKDIQSPLAPKSHIQTVKDRHVSMESTEESPSKPSIKPADGHSVLKESEAKEQKSSIKTVGTMHATSESTETEQPKKHIKLSEYMHSTTESTETERKAHLKTFDGINANLESIPEEQKSQLKMSANFHASKETVQAVSKPKQRNMFGHVSEITQMAQYDVLVPKLKKYEGRHASTESDFKNYQIKPHRRKKVEQRCTAEEETTEKQFRPGIKIDAKHHVSQESQHQQDELDEIRLAKFRERNAQGHSSASTVQGLLYGGQFGKAQTDTEDTTKEKVMTELNVWVDSTIESYDDKFDNLNDPPAVDLIAGLDQFLFPDLGDYGISIHGDISAHSYVSLPALLKRSVTTPLVTQISLVNQSVVAYFTSELRLDTHLKALRKFLLMRDGEFGQSLGDLLFEKLATNPLPHEMLNPMFLNNVLGKAIQASVYGHGEYADNLAFSLKYLPKVLKHNAPDALDCIDLTYKVSWPLNIVITSNSLTKYSRVFSFMLQLKRAVWVLKDVWHKLKRDALINRASTGSQFRRLQLYRHEMQFFVRVMQEYIAHQVIHVTWSEFKADLDARVSNLDDLHNCHGDYLNKLLARCLLNAKAGPVMKILQDIFGLILKFRVQLLSHPWQRDRHTGEVTHPAFSNMCATYNSFNDFSRFLFKVVRKLAIKGYLPHLNELLLRLNFNHHYSADV